MLFIAAFGAIISVAFAQGCVVRTNTTSPFTWKENVLNDPIPDNWHWGNVNGTNYLGTSKNQHLPQYCGSCWAHGTTSAMSDRIAIARKSVFPEIDISPQVLLNCDQVNYGCNGGWPLDALKYIAKNGITDSTCAPYQALSWQEGLKCDAFAICKECPPDSACYVPPKYNTYKIGEYGQLPTLNVAAMKNEIYTRGPIACGINASPILNFTGTDVFFSNDKGSLNHIISIVGFGVTTDGKNTPYWIVRNSWGEYWGDRGYMKVYMGNNTLDIESYCVYMVPVDTWSNQTYPQAGKPSQPETTANEGEVVRANRMFKNFVKRRNSEPCLIDMGNATMEEFVTEPRPQDYLQSNALPDSFWWGNVDGVNYLSWTVNQHLPQYCGSCWAQAALAAMADRINILKGNVFPRVALSVQAIINCRAGGTCNGGTLNGPYVFAQSKGIPEMGCQVYEAKNPPSYECSDIQQCKNCHRDSTGKSTCWAVDTFKRWYAAQYGSVIGADSMKKELFARGPITCGMEVTDKFETYTGGIYSEKISSRSINHAVSVVGWGKDQATGTEYWIVRNSWGSRFGLNGFFEIQMYKDNLNIDSSGCYWVVPSEKKVSIEEMSLQSS